jgi:hypothetical protein
MDALSVATSTSTLQVPENRACELCRHGVTVDGRRRCTHQAAVQPAAWQPVELMRRRGGPCGLEAEHLDFHGLHLRSTKH